MIKAFFIALLILTFGLVGCQKNDEVLNAQGTSGEGVFLSRDWTGAYQGSSTHTYGSVNSSMDYVEYVNQYLVSATVKHGSTPLRFNVHLKFADGTHKDHNDIGFTNDGLHSSNWGMTSSAGSLSIQFTEDQMGYRYTQNCGNSCSTEIEAQLIKD
jgi:hypothetical protein